METATFLKGNCEHCHGHLEFPEESVNKIIICPHCKLPTRLTAQGAPTPVPTPFDLWIPAKTTPRTEVAAAGYIQEKNEWIGWGSLVQLLGLVLLFWFPVGTVIGVLLFGTGHFLARKFVCSHCGNVLPRKEVGLCPFCKASLSYAASSNSDTRWAVGALVFLFAGLGWLYYEYQHMTWRAEQQQAMPSALELLNYSYYENDFGNWFIEGTVTNRSAASFADVRLDFGLYDEKAVEVGIVSAYRPKLTAHENWHFLVEAVVDKLHHVSLAGIHARPAEAKFKLGLVSQSKLRAVPSPAASSWRYP
jgi:hypothetical protein